MNADDEIPDSPDSLRRRWDDPAIWDPESVIGDRRALDDPDYQRWLDREARLDSQLVWVIGFFGILGAIKLIEILVWIASYLL